MPNNNDIKKAIAIGIGSGIADIKAAYKNRIENKAAEKVAAEKSILAQTASKLYPYICVEINEVFNTASEVFDGIEKTNPFNIMLAFNGKTYVSGDSFNYSIPRVRTGENSVEYHIRLIQATINKVCLDRYRQGYSPFLRPFECTLKEEANRYTVSVGDLENEEHEIPPLKCALGQYVGRFKYSPNAKRFYISSRMPQTIYVGTKFQVLDGDGIFYDARFEEDGTIYISAFSCYFPPQFIIGRFVRIMPKVL